MQELQEDYYAVLGVEEKAAPDDIRKAYLKLAKKLHPDRFPNDVEKREAAQLEFSKVTRAHEVLGDPKQREEYDSLRQLAKNKAALDSGTVSSAPASQSQTSSQTMSAVQPGGTNEQWAAKNCTRAEECLKKKRFQEAETAIKEAIRLDPNKPLYHVRLAEVYMARGWKTYAQTEIQAALRLDPKDSDAKNVEMKMKAAAKGQKEEKKKSFMDQLNELFGKK